MAMLKALNLDDVVGNADQRQAHYNEMLRWESVSLSPDSELFNQTSCHNLPNADKSSIKRFKRQQQGKG